MLGEKAKDKSDRGCFAILTSFSSLFFRDSEGRGSSTPGGGCVLPSHYTNTFSPNAITVRGPGNGTLGYWFVRRDDSSFSNDKLTFFVISSYHANSWMGTTLLPTTGPNARLLRSATLAGALRTMRFTVSTLDASGSATIRVEIDYHDGVGFRTELSVAAPKPVPSSYKVGVTSGTGGQMDWHLVRNFVVKSRKLC
jgi:hypothetical protein